MTLFGYYVYNTSHGPCPVKRRLGSLDDLHVFNIVDVDHAQGGGQVGGRLYPVPVYQYDQAVFAQTPYVNVRSPDTVSTPGYSRFPLKDIGHGKGRTFLIKG